MYVCQYVCMYVCMCMYAWECKRERSVPLFLTHFALPSPLLRPAPASTTVNETVHARTQQPAPLSTRAVLIDELPELVCA